MDRSCELYELIQAKKQKGVLPSAPASRTAEPLPTHAGELAMRQSLSDAIRSVTEELLEVRLRVHRDARWYLWEFCVGGDMLTGGGGGELGCGEGSATTLAARLQPTGSLLAGAAQHVDQLNALLVRGEARPITSGPGPGPGPGPGMGAVMRSTQELAFLHGVVEAMYSVLQTTSACFSELQRHALELGHVSAWYDRARSATLLQQEQQQQQQQEQQQEQQDKQERQGQGGEPAEAQENPSTMDEIAVVDGDEEEGREKEKEIKPKASELRQRRGRRTGRSTSSPQAPQERTTAALGWSVESSASPSPPKDESPLRPSSIEAEEDLAVLEEEGARLAQTLCRDALHEEVREVERSAATLSSLAALFSEKVDEQHSQIEALLSCAEVSTQLMQQAATEISSSAGGGAGIGEVASSWVGLLLAHSPLRFLLNFRCLMLLIFATFSVTLVILHTILP